MKNFLTLKTTFIYTTLLTSNLAFAAEINPLNGALLESLKIKLSDRLELPLQYSSRSHRFGIFGYSWCSPLDEKLTIDKKGVKFTACPGAQQDVQIKVNTEGYEVQKSLGNSLFFNKYGELRHWFIENQKYSIEETDDKIILKSSNEEIRLLKQFDQTILQIEKLHEKIKNNKIALSYTMAKLQSIQSPHLALELNYNQFSNLVSLKKNHSLAWSAIYDNQKDTVEKLMLQDSSTVLFNYNTKTLRQNATQISEIKTYRDNKLIDHLTYRFEFLKVFNGWKLRKSSTITTAQQLKESEL